MTSHIISKSGRRRRVRVNKRSLLIDDWFWASGSFERRTLNSNLSIEPASRAVTLDDTVPAQSCQKNSIILELMTVTTTFSHDCTRTLTVFSSAP